MSLVIAATQNGQRQLHLSVPTDRHCFELHAMIVYKQGLVVNPIFAFSEQDFSGMVLYNFMKTISEWRFFNENSGYGEFQQLVDEFIPRSNVVSTGVTGQQRIDYPNKKQIFENRKKVVNNIASMSGEDAAKATMTIAKAIMDSGKDIIIRRRLFDVFLWYLSGEVDRVDPNKIPDWVIS